MPHGAAEFADGKSEQHIADLFSEAGPGGEGALGAEPACSLVLFSPTPSGAPNLVEGNDGCECIPSNSQALAP